MIRASQPTDLREITQIYAHHVLNGTATFEITPPTEAEIANRREDILSKDLPYLVAEVDNVIVGYAYASTYRPRPAYRFTIEDSIYIHPQHTGKGLGKLLLAALIEQCQQGPWRQMIAVIGDSANEASVRLHSSFHFRKVGTLSEVGFKFERWIDTVLMQRSLR